MKRIITSVLLCGAIILIDLGLSENNVIISMIGGLFCGIYDAIINEK
jgi:hypothetical protein